jgi:hypothetical protein
VASTEPFKSLTPASVKHPMYAVLKIKKKSLRLRQILLSNERFVVQIACFNKNKLEPISGIIETKPIKTYP